MHPLVARVLIIHSACDNNVHFCSNDDAALVPFRATNHTSHDFALAGADS